ncbi:hypothetical protein L204_100521 [Cryptococcus depauperatus]|nr:hypothetical protein L204_01549 [Cryptococcus depauperatus CBS 7855]
MTFTPVETFVGGLFLHLATSELLTTTGRVVGISGIVDGAVNGEQEGWKWAIVGGLVAGPVVGSMAGLTNLLSKDALVTTGSIGIQRLTLAGALVGLGSKLGSGCTSGHMLCGLSRLSPRSIIATAVFFATAVVTTNLFPVFPSPDTPAYTLQSPSFEKTLGLLGLLVTFKVINMVTTAAITHSSSKIAHLTPYFVSGLTFSLGLGISGMTDPSKVVGFLCFSSPQSFDPSLALVMLGGVLPNAIHYASLVNKANGEPKPKFSWEKWRVPTNRNVSWRLLGGAAIFGIGWGLAGICPGPALVSIGESIPLIGHDGFDSLFSKLGAFIGSMLAGMFVAGRI